MSEDKKLWEQEEFEDTVAAGIIGLYETRRKKYKGKNPLYSVTDKEINEIKSFGLYFAPVDRIAPTEDFIYPKYQRGILALREEGVETVDFNGYDGLIRGYIHLLYYKRSQERLKPDFFHPNMPGTLYETFNGAIHSTEGLLIGKNYAWLGKDNVVYPVKSRHPEYFPFPGEIKKDEDVARSVLALVNGFYGDKETLWNVRAEEAEAKVTFGVYEEQIKSLFYSRRSPLSTAGRKRPILHWVSSHKRRLKEGIDIDISKYLRGVTEFEMEGTRFTITNPKKLKTSTP